MFGLYTKKDMKRLAARLKEEYSAALLKQRKFAEELKEKNRVLSARVSELEAERAGVSDALIHAEREGKRIARESALSAENERKEFLLLAEKCRLLSEQMLKKYPDAEDSASFAAFSDELTDRLGGEEEDGEFNLDEVLAPKQPLDLKKLCLELGLMEEDE